jgi:hypothetical protein
MTSRLVRTAMRLMPTRRRGWAEALWAETGQAPSGRARLAWRAGGVRLIAREALLAQRAAWLAMLAGAAVWVALVAWPGPASTPATAVNRLNGVAVLALLAGLPLLVRWRFGPLAAGRLPRLLRFGGYALVLALTAQRPRVATATRRAGAGAGLLLGAVLFAAAPVGMANPRLGAASGVAWAAAIAAVFALPVAAGLRAGHRYPGEDDPRQDGRGPLRQGLAAGFLTSGIATLMVTALATVVTALTARTGWMLHWLYPGQRLTPAQADHRALTASLGTDGYAVILAFVPGLGLLLGLSAASAAPPPGGPQLAGADADGP